MKQTKIAVSKLRSFENNPYQVRDDAEMNTLIESIQNHVREESLVIQDSFLRFALADFQRFHFLMVQDSLELASHHRGSQKHTQHPVQNNIH